MNSFQILKVDCDSMVESIILKFFIPFVMVLRYFEFGILDLTIAIKMLQQRHCKIAPKIPQLCCKVTAKMYRSHQNAMA